MPPKIKVFGWKLAARAITVKEILARRGVPIAPSCLMCDHAETHEHLIFRCVWVKQVWMELLGTQDASDRCNSIED